MGSKSAPKAPDYAAAAAEQAQSSKEVTNMQTWANRPDQVTPWGTTSWQSEATIDPATGQPVTRWTQNTSLNKDAQDALDSQLRLQRDRSQLGESLTGRMQNEYGTAMDWSNLTPAGQAVNAPTYSSPGAMYGPAYGPQYSTEGLNAYGQGPTQGQYSQEQIQRGLSTEGMQDIDSSQKYFNQANDAIYKQWADRALPEQQRQTESTRTRLYNMGLREGDAAFDREMNRLGESQGDALRQAQYQATIGAGSEAQRMLGMDASVRQQQFGERQAQGNFANQAAQQSLNQQLGIGGQRYNESLGGANYANQLRQQQLGEMVGMGQQNYQNQQAYIDALNQQRSQGLQEQMAIGQQNFQNQMQQSQYQNQLRQQQMAEQMQMRGWTLNEINALLSGQQVGMPTMPSFSQAQRSEGNQSLQAAQMQGQADLDRFNAKQAAIQGMMSGVGDMAGGFAGFSDRRLKYDVQKVGELEGVNLYTWIYKWGQPSFGVMADEVPHAIAGFVNDYAVVDYGRIW